MRLRRAIRRSIAFATGSIARALHSPVLVAAVGLTAFAFVVDLASQAQDVDAARASVVRIVSKNADGKRRIGTGFVVRVEPDLVYIATASHVVEEDFAPQVEFLTRRNRPVTAAIIKTEGDDMLRGIALVVVRGKENIPERLRALRFDSAEELQGGQEVIAIGFGQGQGDWAVIRANVASVDGRDIRLDGRIEEGNSGGPILKGDQVVGLITGTQGFGQATPAQFVETILRRWGVAVTTADTAIGPSPPSSVARRSETSGSDPRYVLRSTGGTEGRTYLSTQHTELRDGTLMVDGVSREGPATLVIDLSTETQVLRVSRGEVTRIRLTFLTHSYRITRAQRGGTIVNPLQGKTIIGERSDGQWSFSSPGGSLSPGERQELASMYGADEEALYPADPVPVGDAWEVSGAELRKALGLGSGEGSVMMRFRSVVSCGLEQCAEIGIDMRLADRTGQGVTLRTLKEGFVVKSDLTGQAVYNFGVIPNVGNMSVAGRYTSTITGSAR